MKILAIATHPDDETLGAGGMLIKHREKGSDIYWLIVTKSPYEDQIEIREKEIEAAAQAYGFKEVFRLNKKATTLAEADIPFLVSEIDKIVQGIQPDIVLVPSHTDVHSDHRIVAQACFALAKPHRYPFIKMILAMEVLSETDLGGLVTGSRPRFSYFEDITNSIEKKLSILKIYQSEIGAFPFPRSTEAVEALAKVRGAAIGVKYAEAFCPLKVVGE